MKTINERIQLIVDQYFDGNVSKYCREIGVKQPTMNDILGVKRIKPSMQTLEKMITGKSVKINAEWLILGEGEMLKKDEKKEESGSNPMVNSIFIELKDKVKEDQVRLEVLREQLEDARKLVRDLTELNAILKYKEEHKNEAASNGAS